MKDFSETAGAGVLLVLALVLSVNYPDSNIATALVIGFSVVLIYSVFNLCRKV